MGTSDLIKTQCVGVVNLPSAYDNCSIFGKYFHTWVWKFFFKNRNNKDLRPEDLHKCPKSCNSSLLGLKLEQYWEEHLKCCKIKNKKPNLFWPVFRMFFCFYLFISILCVIGYLFQIALSYSLGELIDYVEKYHSETLIEKKNEYLQKVYISGICIAACQLTYILFINPFFFYASKVGMNIRVACCSLIYRKALKLSKSSFLFTTTGQIVNMLSNDTSRFDLAPLHTPFLFYGPLSAFLAIFVLWPYLNYTTVYGVAILSLYIPLQAFMGNRFSKLRSKAALLTDKRVRLMNEFIPAMRVIKMYTWEKPFAKMVNLVREEEISKIKKSAYLRALNIGLFYVSAKIIVFFIFCVWILKGNQLDAKTVFLTFSLMNHIRLSITLMLPNAISFGSEGLISFKRITTFLSLPERQESSNLNICNFVVKKIDIELSITKLFASYGVLSDDLKKLKKKVDSIENKSKSTTLEKNSKDFSDLKDVLNVLRNINLNCKPGELNVIVGPVGSGKSSILLSILGELNINSGSINIKGRISYASQEAWTFAGTVRDNILFNSLYDPEKYKQVVRVCALERDFTLFPQNDLTIIGDRGVALSGGQRARINLARSLYYDADIYLLDDPLSAVDAHVAKHIFNEAIKGYLSNKVVILVTHQLQFIKSANKILLIKNGEQVAYGDYNTLLSNLNNKLEFSEFIGVNVNQSTKNVQQPMSYRTVSINSESSLHNPMGSSLSLSSSIQLEETESSEDLIATSNTKQSLNVDNKNFETSNTREAKKESENLSGSWSSYWIYVKLGSSWWLGPLLILIFICLQTLFTGSDYWLSLWTDSEERKNLKHKSSMNQTSFVDNFTNEENILIYATQMLLLFIFSLLRAIVFFILCMRTSVRLHDRLFKNLIRAPMSFFDNNPIGTILNRCSRDMGTIDDIIPATAFDAVTIISTDTGIAVSLGLINVWNLLPLVVLLSLILIIRNIYIGVARKIKIIEGINKSPVFTQLSSSLFGLTTIRAFNVQKKFENRFDILQNDHSSAWFFYIVTSRWLLFHMDLCSVIFVGGVTFSVIFFVDQFNSSTVGFLIASTIMFSSGFQWCMKQWTELETQMTSVDRVEEYNSLPSEGDLESDPKNKPKPSWPEKGTVTFKNVYMRYYQDEKPVLKDICIEIEEKQKIGIVGRTGAGKSSIIAALFRMTNFDGDIIIDGVKIKEIGLHDLRKKIAIIPQEPVLFTGTVRSNLDPFDEHPDSDLWKALKEVQLNSSIETMKEGLDGKITDGGSNFSVGQKQLICLARAILRGNKILILDEATANCDPKTDELIQKTIRTVFSECTIITIAHRLHTIMDSDKILVLDAGEVKEFNTPQELINKKDSLFNQMITATGKEMARNLRKTAKEIFLLKSKGILPLELSEKIQKTIIDEDNASETKKNNSITDDEEEELKNNENKNEWTHF